MKNDNLDRSFIIYLEEKGIKCVKRFEEEKTYEDINESDISNQIEAIKQFHIRNIGYTGFMNKRLENNIGKTIEHYKVYTKRFSKFITKISQQDEVNKFEQEVLKYGYEYLERAKKCIDNIYSNGYVALILRSMQRTEMCLGSTYFNNLTLGEYIEIKSIENCCYNMVEMDFVYFFNKLKKRSLITDSYNLIEEFCYKESLDNKSNKFISSLVSYPYEFMKCCNRYREKSKGWTDNEYVNKLHKAIKLDGNSLI